MTISLDQSLIEFRSRRMIAMPIAGTIMWAIIGIAGLFLPDSITTWVLFIGTGSIFYLVIPFVIVVLYIAAIVVLNSRWRQINQSEINFA